MSETPLTTIYIVRHGQSTGNVDQTTGGSDPELTELGRQQITEVTQKLKKIHFDTILCSDLKRAVQTAEILRTENQLEVKVHDVLRERSYGSFYTNKSREEIRALIEQLHQKVQSLTDDELWHHKEVDDMESNEEAITRFITFLREVAIAYQGQTVLIVGHGNLMRSFLVKLGYAKLKELPTNTIVNGAVITVTSDGVDFFLDEVSGVNKKSL